MGAPSSSSPHSVSNVFVLPGGEKVKVSAQCVKFKDARGKVVPVGNKLAIPDSYAGWFEILSEDGRAAKAIDTVAELAKKFPDSCVLRESLKVWIGKGDESEPIAARWKVLSAGEKVVLVGRVSSDGAHVDAEPNDNKNEASFLRCFDQNGKSVYLRLDQKGRFSPIAKDDGLAGLHTVRQLIKKRFPLMVRLVHGNRPTASKTFLPEMRLLATYREECVFALPLTTRKSKRAIVEPVAVATSAQLKLQATDNNAHLSRLIPYQRMVEKYEKMVKEVEQNIQVLDSPRDQSESLSRSSKNRWKSRFVRRSSSEPENDAVNDAPEATAPATSDVDNSSSNDKNYDEIDQIYNYVRGFIPLPKWIRAEAASPPMPPPIETIPIRRHSVPVSAHASKPAAIEAGRRYAKRQRQRHVPKWKDKAKAEAVASTKAVSPFFHMRYKSLTDLASTEYAANSTNSTGSGGSVPAEKCDRPRLLRPRSLTDLLLNVRANNDRADDQDSADKFLGTLYL